MMLKYRQELDLINQTLYYAVPWLLGPGQTLGEECAEIGLSTSSLQRPSTSVKM